MDKDSLLKSIAETGYNVGFGAKKHFATYDVVEKLPGWIGFFASAIGIFGLVYEPLSGKWPSATLAVLGISGLYAYFYDSRKGEYEAAGKTLTRIFYDLRDLYRSVKGGAAVDASLARLKELELEFYAASISKQIAASDWYAHYKFFAQMQIDWIEEQKHFTIWDKVPLGLRLVLVILLVALAVAGYYILTCRC